MVQFDNGRGVDESGRLPRAVTPGSSPTGRKSFTKILSTPIVVENVGDDLDEVQNDLHLADGAVTVTASAVGPASSGVAPCLRE
jgi:hypothetical protein